MSAGILTAIGGMLVGIAGIVGAAVTFVGKRGENALTGYTSLTDNLQEERDRLAMKVDAQAEEIKRLHGLIIDMGGKP